MSKSKKTTKAIPGQDQVDSATAALNERDTKIAGLENTLNQARNTIKLLRQSEYSEGQIREEIYRLARVSPNPPKWLTDLPKGSTFGVPMSLWSDWHAGEVVTPQEVGGTNEFNTAVLNVRVKRLVDQIIDVCFNKMTHTSYPGIVVCLGGDMISGDIHEELAVTNDRYTLQTLHDLLDVLIAAITKLADRFGNVFLPCVPGNHGRSTKKPRAKGRAFTSYEWHLYCLLERYFQGDKRIRFYIPPETDAHFTVSNHRFLLTHGDALGVKGGDGIIGAIGPIMRGKVKVSNAESHIGRSFDTILMGHWHQYIALMGCIVNGCFTPDTLVQTDKGARQIVDIKKGDIVLSRDGSWQTVTHKFTKQSDQGLVKLKVRGLPELLNVTPNHLVWGVKAESALAAVEPKWRSAKGNADKPQWIPADFISPGDWVHIPRHFGSDKAFSKNLAWVYGLFIAEGHTIVDGGASGAHNRIEFSCHIDELPWLEKVKKILVKEMPELVNNSNVRIWTRPNKTTSHLSVSGRDIAVKFREMFGHTSHNKKIPDSFRNLSPEIAKAVVQGWLDGDGHTAYKADCVVTSATTVSKQLAHDMFALALTSGYNPSLAKLSKGGPRKSDSYTIHFNAGQETRVINDELFYRVHHRFRTEEKVKVYDLEVSGEHTYNAGFVGVHNSLKGYDEYARLFIRAPFQLPIQAMWFVNPQGQVSNNIPIYLEDQLESTDFNDHWVSWNPTDDF